jgi:hypothetical protein
MIPNLFRAVRTQIDIKCQDDEWTRLRRRARKKRVAMKIKSADKYKWMLLNIEHEALVGVTKNCAIFSSCTSSPTFRGTYRLHLQGIRVSEIIGKQNF